MGTTELFQNNVNLQTAFVKDYNRTEKIIIEDVETIRNWLKTQEHLPELMDDSRIRAFLILNKFSIEKTKQRIDMYYTIRTKIPEYYIRTQPNLSHMQRVMDMIYMIHLPKLTKDLYRVCICKIRDPSLAEDLNMNHFVAHMNNITEVRLMEDTSLGDIYIYDVSAHNVKHMTIATPMDIVKCVTVYQKVFSAPFKASYVVNCTPMKKKMFTILQTLIKPKLFERIHVHENSDVLLKTFPKEILPKDYGGEEKSLEELNELLKVKLLKYQSRFEKLETLKVNEDRRANKLENDINLGTYGNFKKLDVD